MPYAAFASSDSFYAEYAALAESQDPYGGGVYDESSSSGTALYAGGGVSGYGGMQGGGWDGGFWMVCHGLSMAIQSGGQLDICADGEAMAPFLNENLPADKWARMCKAMRDGMLRGDDSACADFPEDKEHCRIQAAMTRAYQSRDPKQCPPGAAGGVCRAILLKTKAAACEPLWLAFRSDFCVERFRHMDALGRPLQKQRSDSKTRTRPRKTAPARR